MRKISIFFLMLSFYAFNLASLGYASPQTQKENDQIKFETPKVANKAMKGYVEFSTAASLDIDRIKTKVNGEEREDVLTMTTFSVPLRVGYFLTDNIEIEPEINFDYVSMSYQDDSASASTVLLLANVAYNFDTPSQVMPFVLGGVGIMAASISEDEESESESGFAWNLGGGIKWFAANRVALRIEYRLIHFSSTTDWGNEIEITTSHTNHRIFVGLSIFF